MGYKLELGAWSAVFAVPNALVDRYIKEADGDQLKVMLWLLRHNGRPYAAEDLAAALGITPQRVDTALGFWMKSGLICSVDTPLDTALTPNHVESPTPVAPQPKAAPTQPQRPTAPKRMLRPDGLYISERVESSPEIRRLVEEAQNLLGKTLSPALSGTLIQAHEDYGLPCEVSNADIYGTGYADEVLSIKTAYETLFLGMGLPITYTRFSLGDRRDFPWFDWEGDDETEKDSEAERQRR